MKSWYLFKILFMSVILIKFVCLVYKILTCSEFSWIFVLRLSAEIVHILSSDSSISLLMWTNFPVEKSIILHQKLIFRLMSLSHDNSSTTLCYLISVMLNYILFIWGLIQSLISFISWSTISLLYLRDFLSMSVTA